MERLNPDFGDRATRILLAVAAEKRPTVSTIASLTGYSRASIHHHLTELRRAGLVTWTKGEQGTLKAVYRPVRS